MMKNIVINGSDNKPIALDIHLAKTQPVAPLIIYAHGFNGFKNWGNGDGMADWFTENGYHFLKFNFSHNGTSPEQSETFCELENFGNNNFSKQLFDLNEVINWIHHPLHPLSSSIDYKNIILIGHSMGGGVSILHAAKDARISQLITWAAIGEAKTPWGKWSEEKIQQWQKDGVSYYFNARTQQELPLYYQLKEDFDQHQEQLNISKAAQQLHQPWLICHAEDDTAVSCSIAQHLLELQPASQLFITQGGHTFGRKHPQDEPFHTDSIHLWEHCLQFIQNNINA